jgi:hypothetical protein
MNKFDYRGQLKVVTPGISAGTRHEDYQGGPQSFAPAADYVVSDPANQHDFGIEPVTNDFVHRPQVCGNQIVDEVGRHVAGWELQKSKSARW